MGKSASKAQKNDLSRAAVRHLGVLVPMTTYQQFHQDCIAQRRFVTAVLQGWVANEIRGWRVAPLVGGKRRAGSWYHRGLKRGTDLHFISLPVDAGQSKRLINKLSQQRTSLAEWATKRMARTIQARRAAITGNRQRVA